MEKKLDKLKKRFKKTSKKELIIYFTLRILIILCLIGELLRGNYENALLCVLSLALFFLPAIAERTFKIDLPEIMEIIIFFFIFAAEILGEINNFYGIFKNFDTILHTLNGFLCASFGFSLVYLLNENITQVKLSPLFVAIVAFCFSMTIGVAWEFFEYGMDNIIGLDMQKDEYVEKINTVTLDPKQNNNVVKIDDIKTTILYDSNKNKLVELNGYLYLCNSKKYKLAGRFITKRA